MASDILLATINAKWIHPSLALRLLKANLGPLEERCAIMEFALRQPLAEKVAPILAANPRILGLSVSIWNHAATVELLKALRKEQGTGELGLGTGDCTGRDWGEITGEDLTQRRRGAEDAKKRGKKERSLKAVFIYNTTSSRTKIPAPCSLFPIPRSPFIILGGPEVSHLPPDAEIFQYADFVVRGEGEHLFRKLCEQILNGDTPKGDFTPEPVDLNSIKTGYYLYSDEDLCKKMTYVESSRGCPFSCEFCMAAASSLHTKVRHFPLDTFLAEMDGLVERGARTFKFLDRAFNADIERACKIMEFFLEKIDIQLALGQRPLVVHFEMLPSRFPQKLRETLMRFPPGTLRLEIGIQTFNEEVAARIGRPSAPEKELEALQFLREKTNAIIHADLIAGLPGEGMVSFGNGFDRLWDALFPPQYKNANNQQAAQPSSPHAEKQTESPRVEIQLGILKLLPGASLARHTKTFGMRYNPQPPYEVLETAALPACELDRIKNFARFWELIVNRALGVCRALPILNGKNAKKTVFEHFLPCKLPKEPVNRKFLRQTAAKIHKSDRLLVNWQPTGPSAFLQFMALSDSLLERFGRNWGIDKNELRQAVEEREVISG